MKAEKRDTPTNQLWNRYNRNNNHKLHNNRQDEYNYYQQQQQQRRSPPCDKSSSSSRGNYSNRWYYQNKKMEPTPPPAATAPAASNDINNRMELINENYKAFCDALLEAGQQQNNYSKAPTNGKRKMRDDDSSPRCKRDFTPDQTSKHRTMIDNRPHVNGGSNAFVSLSRPDGPIKTLSPPMRNELERIIEGRQPHDVAETTPKRCESPLNLCTSPRVSRSPSPQTSPLPGNMSPLSAPNCEDTPADPPPVAKDRDSPQLKLTLKRTPDSDEEKHAGDKPGVTSSVSTEKPPVAAKKTSRKLSDRSRPCPIDLSRSKTILEDPGASPMFPLLSGRLGSNASLLTSLNTPDSVCRRTPSETNASFFGAANMLASSPMVSETTYNYALPSQFKILHQILLFGLILGHPETGVRVDTPVACNISLWILVMSSLNILVVFQSN